MSAAGYVLRVPQGRRAILLQGAGGMEWGGPAEPVSRFKLSRQKALVVFASFADDAVTHVANGRRGSSAGTDLVRLNLIELEELSTPVPFAAIRDAASKSVRSHLSKALDRGGLLPPKSLGVVVDEVLRQNPGISARLNRFSEARRVRLRELPPKSVENLALQKEALTAALSIAGMDRDDLLRWDPPAAEGARSFLEGLPQAYVREDAMVISDFSATPGYEAVRDLPYAAKEFRDPRNPANRLTVIVANRFELEKQTGTDLIYYNETHKCFIMVQYKAMEEGSAPTFRWKEGDDLQKEIERMDDILDRLSKAKRDDGPGSFRFSENPFFLKICRRIVLDPDSKGLFPGMYFPLGLWKSLANDPSTLGKKGGRYLTYQNASRRLSNSEFVGLVKGAWIGTTVPQSEMLEEIIREVLAEGKAVTLAIKKDPPPPPDLAADELWDSVEEEEEQQELPPLLA